jgi:hypothetical protein
MPAEQVDAMLASSGAPAQPAPRPARHPVVTLLREVEKRPSVKLLRVRKGNDLVEWRRAT